MYENIDPLTGETFETNRSNQVFASRRNQVIFNNLKVQKVRNVKASINRILDNNRSILEAILGGELETEVGIDFMKEKGFEFGCLTHFLKRDEQQWICVYDYAYSRSDSEITKIIKL